MQNNTVKLTLEGQLYCAVMGIDPALALEVGFEIPARFIAA